MENGKRLKVFFMGTPAIACPVLARLDDTEEIQVQAVVTQPDKPRGRDLKLQPSEVKTLAQSRGLPVHQPEKARDPEFLEQVKSWKPDVGVVMAYGQILPQALLEIPPHGCLNIHTSLLPKFRGAAPIQHALLNGEKETGVTIMKMDAGMDTGPIVLMEQIPIGDNETAVDLHDHLARLGADTLMKALEPYILGELMPRPQTGEATYAPRIKKEDGQIDWEEPADKIRNRLRAFTPWPGLFTYLPGTPKKLLKIWNLEIDRSGDVQPGTVVEAGPSAITVGTGIGKARVLELQLEGSKRMTAAQFLSGHKLVPGTLLG